MRLKQALIAAALVGVAALGGGLWKYGEWLMAFSDSNLRILFPEDVALTPPGPEIAPDVAGFAGIWAGDRWAGGAVPHALVVERLHPNGAASVIFAWGADQVLHRQHGFTRVRGH